MRAAAVLGEAGRNLATGTTRALLLAAALVLVVGGLAAADVRAVVSVLADADAFRTSGAATQVLKGPIDGARCAALSGTSGIGSAGAARPGDPVRALAMPSAQLTTWEVTPGLVDLLQQVARPAAAASTAAAGVWVSADLADTLGLQPGSLLPTDAGTATVAGIYTWPDDGRARDLGYALLTPVPATGEFAQCWAQVWPQDADATALLYTALVPGAGVAAGQITFGQLNATPGTSFDTAGRLASRLTVRAPWAAALAGLLLGFLAVRLRRLQLASALHARVRRVDLAWQQLLEAGAWTLVAATVAAAGLAFLAADGNPDPARATWLIGLRTVASGAAAALLGTLAATLATREKHLFRYAKDR